MVEFAIGKIPLLSNVSSFLGLWWVDLGWMPGIHQAILSLPSAGCRMGWEKIRWKKPLADLDKGSLQKQKWRSCECKQREKSHKIYSVLPISKQCPAACWEAGLYHRWLRQKLNVVNNECTCLFFSFLLPFISEQTSHGMEHPFGQFGSVTLVMTPPRILSTPFLLVLRDHWSNRAGSVQVLPSCGRSPGVLSASFHPPRQSTGSTTVGKIVSI